MTFIPTQQRLSQLCLTRPFRLSWQKGTLRFTQPRRTTRGLLHERTGYLIICELIDTAGDTQPPQRGYGEACPIAGLSPEYQHTAAYEARLTEACHEIEQRQELVEHDMADCSSIRLALEGALLRAHAGATPIWESPFTLGRCGLPIHHLIWMESPEQMAQQAAAGVEAGFTCLKLKIGAHPWEQEHALLTQLRARYPQLEIRVDANGSLPPLHAQRQLDELAELDISWIEQPLLARTESERTRLHRLIEEAPPSLRIALDEQLIGLYDEQARAELLDHVAPHGLVLKPSLHGGLIGCESLIRMAHARGIHCWVNSMLESRLGLGLLAEWTAAILPDTLHALSKGKLYCQQPWECEFPSCQLVKNTLVYEP